MNQRYEIPETSINIRRINNRRINKNGDEPDNQDCIGGISLREDGVFQLDLRNLRPIRVLDRDCLIIEVYLKDVLMAIADQVEREIKS